MKRYAIKLARTENKHQLHTLRQERFAHLPHWGTLDDHTKQRILDAEDEVHAGHKHWEEWKEEHGSAKEKGKKDPMADRLPGDRSGLLQTRLFKGKRVGAYLLRKSNKNHGEHGRFASSNSEPVNIEIPETMRGLNNDEFRDAAKQYAKEHYANTSVQVTSDNTSVDIPWQGIKHAFSRGVSPEKSAVALRLDEVIKSSTKDRTEQDTDGRNTIVAVHHYKTQVTIDGGKVVNVGIVLREHIDGSRYYDHYEIKRPASISGELTKGQVSHQPITGRLILIDFSVDETETSVNDEKPTIQNDIGATA